MSLKLTPGRWLAVFCTVGAAVGLGLDKINLQNPVPAPRVRPS